jgi:23S rRNA (adenine2503-C2)-methyltransferase
MPDAADTDFAPRRDQTTEDGRVDLKTLDREGLEAFVEALGEPAYRGRQLFNWIYGKGATTFEAMSSLPKSFRRRLQSVATLRGIDVVRRQQADDGTVKALFRLPSGRKAETVLIPDLDASGTAQRLTVCVSSQVGCAMGCTFCATGLMGFQENLTAGAIYDQVWHMDEVARERFGRPVSNVVFMGMGEPLLNYDSVLQSVDLLTDEDTLNLSVHKVTVSTVGLARRIRDLADDGARFHLAVSLHAPTNETRSEIMPINEAEKTSLPALKDAITHYHEVTGRSVTYEYCLFRGVNDSDDDARRLAEIARWVPSKVNLMLYNPVEGLNYERPSEERLDAFIETLVREGVTATVRRSRGEDIDAACGQLANKTDDE